jgi:hypothetical protein
LDGRREHAQNVPPPNVTSEKLFDQRRERAMIFDCRLLGGFFEIDINPKIDLRRLLALLRHGFSILMLHRPPNEAGRHSPPKMFDLSNFGQS